jgi:serine/threonine protein phosphatase PrpC
MARLLSAASSRKRDGRTHSQDVFYHDANLGLYAVVDGGSSTPGPNLDDRPLRAAQDVTDILIEECRDWPLLLASADQHRRLLQRAICRAHEAILGRACVAQVAAVRVHPGSSNWATVAIASVGSVRVYHRKSRSGELAVLTVDNTDDSTSNSDLFRAQMNQLYRDGLCAAKDHGEAVRFRTGQHFSGPCLGDPMTFNTPRAQTTSLEPGDVLLIASNGLGNLTTREIAVILSKYATEPQAASDALVEAAYDRSRDASHLRARPGDITALVVYSQP